MNEEAMCIEDCGRKIAGFFCGIWKATKRVFGCICGCGQNTSSSSHYPVSYDDTFYPMESSNDYCMTEFIKDDSCSVNLIRDDSFLLDMIKDDSCSVNLIKDEPCTGFSGNDGCCSTDFAVDDCCTADVSGFD